VAPVPESPAFPVVPRSPQEYSAVPQQQQYESPSEPQSAIDGAAGNLPRHEETRIPTYRVVSAFGMAGMLAARLTGVVWLVALSAAVLLIAVLIGLVDYISSRSKNKI
jgi:hypothetical protein